MRPPEASKKFIKPKRCWISLREPPSCEERYWKSSSRYIALRSPSKSELRTQEGTDAFDCESKSELHKELEIKDTTEADHNSSKDKKGDAKIHVEMDKNHVLKPQNHENDFFLLSLGFYDLWFTPLGFQEAWFSYEKPRDWMVWWLWEIKNAHFGRESRQSVEFHKLVLSAVEIIRGFYDLWITPLSFQEV